MADRRLAWALVAVIVRYLMTIQPHARRELARWRRHALAIPDPELRAHVLRPFDADSSALGAALFAVLAPLRMQRRLVRLLIAYVLLWSYVDVRTERDPGADPRLYDALVDALREGGTMRLPDGERYLCTLLAACHRGCAALPSWYDVQPVALRSADDGRTVQAINHGPRADAEPRLRAWARRRPGRPWWERCAAASSPLPIHALMALAAQPSAGVAQAVVTANAYEPVSALGTLCDHLIDQGEDDALANHSYLRYGDTARAREPSDLAALAARSVSSLPAGRRHTVILAAMIAMFLARLQAETGAAQTISRALTAAIGLPAARFLAMWRAGWQLPLSRVGAAERIRSSQRETTGILMPMEAKIDAVGRIVVPKPMRDALGLARGSIVDISRYGAGLQIVPAGRTARVVDEAGVLVATGKTTIDDDTVFGLIDAARR